MNDSTLPSQLATLHAHFLALLPRIETHGRIYFRHVKCQCKKDEAIAEMRALAWKWFLRLAQRGKDPADFLVTFTRFLARAVNSGKRLCGQEKAKDVLSNQAQQKHGFVVETFSQNSSPTGNVWDEALQDNTQSEVLDQVIFRIDFPKWRSTFTERDQRLIDQLMVGEQTDQVARKFGLTPGRVSQLRREYKADWQRFNDELISEAA